MDEMEHQTPETAHCLLGTPFSGALTLLEEEEDKDGLHIREYVGPAEPRLIGVEQGESDGGFGYSKRGRDKSGRVTHR
jgi:hypothetical protein